MKQLVYSLTLIFFCCSITNSIAAQVADDARSLASRLTSYSSQVLEEKIFVHTDKHQYQSGEIMWFKVYCVDRQQNQPLSLSKVVYLELLDNQNRQVLQAKVSMDSGAGSGAVIIPPSLPTGSYRLRSYTHWMKNFNEDYFFRQVITVTNGRRVLPAIKDPALQFDIQFFPEGGHLVEGLESKLAFKVADQYGNGADFTGHIIDDRRDTVASFSPMAFGMGSFRFRPAKGKTYSAVIYFSDGSIVTQELSGAQSNGYVMTVTPADGKRITVQVSTNVTGASKLYLLVHTRLSLKLAEAGKINNGEVVFNIGEDVLGEGISSFTIFDAAKEPVCERLYFRYPQRMNGLTLQTDQAAYQHRKKINLQFRSAQADSGNFSLSVYRMDNPLSAEYTSIHSWLWLQSELRGKIESPGFYFDEKEPNRKTALDNLLLTQGFRKFDWNGKDSTVKPAFVYEPEHRGIIVQAKVIDTRSGLPVPNIQAFAGAPGNRTNFITGYSNDSGYLKLEMPELYGSTELVLQTNSTTADSVYRVDIIQPYAEKFHTDSLPVIPIHPSDTTAILEGLIGSQVQFLYSEEQVNRFDTLSIDTTTFFVHADRHYWFDDYTRFTTMEEVLREYVQWVIVRKRDNDFHLMVYDAERKEMMPGDPLVLMDGVPVLKMNKVLELDPLKIRKLDVIAKRYIIGNNSFEGILNFISYNGDLEGYTLDRNATVVDYEGMQLRREFYSPAYEAQDSTLTNIPDFRTSLYWKSDIILKSGEPVDLSFFSSDLKGKFIVVVQGMSKNGISGEATTGFTVE